MKEMIIKASALKADQLKKWLAENVSNTDDGVMMVFDAMLAALESKMSETEFVQFVEGLEAAL